MTANEEMGRAILAQPANSVVPSVVSLKMEEAGGYGR